LPPEGVTPVISFSAVYENPERDVTGNVSCCFWPVAGLLVYVIVVGVVVYAAQPLSWRSESRPAWVNVYANVVLHAFLMPPTCESLICSVWRGPSLRYEYVKSPVWFNVPEATSRLFSVPSG
jgi:hypothetical protein